MVFFFFPSYSVSSSGSQGSSSPIILSSLECWCAVAGFLGLPVPQTALMPSIWRLQMLGQPSSPCHLGPIIGCAQTHHFSFLLSAETQEPACHVSTLSDPQPSIQQEAEQKTLFLKLCFLISTPSSHWSLKASLVNRPHPAIIFPTPSPSFSWVAGPVSCSLRPSPHMANSLQRFLDFFTR